MGRGTPPTRSNSPAADCGLRRYGASDALEVRAHLVTVGAITAGVALIAVGPGVWLLVSSGSHTEVLLDGTKAATAPRAIGLRAAF